jgi:hypothetical protein
MNAGEFYRAEPDKVFPDGTNYRHVIKLLRRIPAGQEAQPGGYTFKEDGWDFDTLLCNSSITPNAQYAPVLDSELNRVWVKITPAEVLHLEEKEMSTEPSLWDHDRFMEKFEGRASKL